MLGMHPAKGAFPFILPYHHGLVFRFLFPEKEPNVHIKGFGNPEESRHRRGNGVVFDLGQEAYGKPCFPCHMTKRMPFAQTQVPDLFTQLESAEF
jgi:hypothetical protein